VSDSVVVRDRGEKELVEDGRAKVLGLKLVSHLEEIQG
jgi:hypothetical protein